MIYELIENNGFPCIVVNSNIFFAWDPKDIDNYGIFMQKLEEKGIEVFAQLLSDNPNTAFTIFCDGI